MSCQSLTSNRNIYPDRLEYVDQILAYASEKTAEYADSADLHSAASQSNMLNLLLAPIKTYFSLFTALALPHYIPLFSSQTYATRRAVAGEVARSVLRNRTIISSSEHLDGVLSILNVLIKEGLQQPSGYSGLQTRQRSGETDETIEEQGWLARMVHLIKAPDNDTQYKVCSSAYCHVPQTDSCSSFNKLVKHTNKVVIALNTPPHHSSPKQ